MATTGIVNGHNMRWNISGTVIAKATNCTISLTMDPIDTTHKDVGGPTGWGSISAGKLSWEGSCDALYAEGESFETLWTAFSTGAAITVEFSTDVTGDKNFSGSAYITSLELNAPDNEHVSYSTTFVGDGTLSRGTEV